MVRRLRFGWRPWQEIPPMMPGATIFVIDDDQAMRSSLRRLLERVGFAVATYANAHAFLEAYDPTQPGCVLLDIRMPGMSGLELQQKLAEQGVRTPVIIISAHGDVEKAVRAMRAGAVDFIKKPYKGKELLARVREALELDARVRRQEAERAELAGRFARLTPREREVMALLVAGQHAKEIAHQLGLSRKTVDVHRGHVMAKMQTDSLAELVRMAQHLSDERDDTRPR
jgi:FixJ family two-component response regulator